MTGSSVCSWARDFVFSTASRPHLGTTQPSVQHVQGALSPGYQDKKLTTHLSLVPRLKLCRVMPPVTHNSAWHGFCA